MFANLTNRLTEQEGKCYICSEAAIGGVLLKESVFKNFTKFTAKHLCQGLFFNKVSDRPATLLKETLAQVFTCEFCDISKNTFLHKTPLVDTSVIFTS